MPKRNATKRVITTDAQGDDSWVIVRKPNVKEIRMLVELAGNEPETLKQGVILLQDHIQQWNWVEDDGSDMSLPKDDPEVLDRLYMPELKALFNALLGDEQARKN